MNDPKLVHRLATMRSHPRMVTHAPKIASWTGPELTIAVIADLHVVAPWTSLDHVAGIVQRVNDTAPDLIVLAGDFLADRALPGTGEPAHRIADTLSALRADLGVVAILGNHDWQDCPLAKDSKAERNSVAEAFADTDMVLLQNSSLAISHQGREFWLVGFDSQLPTRKNWKQGMHRPDQAFADVPDGAPSILLAHEPDYFAQGDTRANLQISGHTHGGQLNLLGWRPMTPSQYGGRYAYGHTQDGDRHLIVSGGIGFSGLPLRIGQAPEITMIMIAASKR